MFTVIASLEKYLLSFEIRCFMSLFTWHFGPLASHADEVEMSKIIQSKTVTRENCTRTH